MGRKKREKNRLRQEINLLLLIWLLIYVTRPQAKGEVLGVSNESIVEPVAISEVKETVPMRIEVSLMESRKEPVSQTNEVEIIIEKWAGEYGVNPEIMKKIARCESGFASGAINGTYGGIFQFSETTWVSTRTAMGEDANLELRFDAQEAVKTAAWKMARDGTGAWKNCAN